MPKRIRERTRYTIAELYDRGWTKSAISLELHVNRKTVDRWCVRNSCQDLPRRRSKVPVTPRLIRLWERKLCQGNTMRQLSRESGVNYSTLRKSVRRTRINKNGLYPYKPQPCLDLNAQQTAKRAAYVRTFSLSNGTRLLQQLMRLIFYDETWFELDAPPNKQNKRCWARNRNTSRRRYKKRKQSVKVHSFMAISWFGKSEIRWYVERGNTGNACTSNDILTFN